MNMPGGQDVLSAVIEAFSETVQLKLEQFYRVVPKGSNSDLTGEFVEAVVRGFVRQWIAPCQLCHGTFHPHDAAKDLPGENLGPSQIDGIVYDPRLGPTIIGEEGFVVVHPAFCRGIVEIKASTNSMKGFEDCLQLRYRKYLAPAWEGWPAMSNHDVMGIVLHDADPQRRSHPDWLSGIPLYHYRLVGHCPIFILFEEDNGDYKPYTAAIDAMIKAFYQSGWQRGTIGERVPGGPLLP
jgi:hypothetical protein